MSERKGDRWGAVSGYVALALGLGAASFERGSPPANAPVEQLLGYFARYRLELRAQSLLFVLSAGALLWFAGCLRDHLHASERGTGRLSSVAFGAGVIWAGLQLVMQAVQAALAMGATPELPAQLAGTLADLTYALSVIAYVPMAVMLLAVAVVSRRFKAFPAWLGCLSAAGGAVNLLMSAGLLLDGGPLVPGAPLTYVLYLLQAVWQVSVPTVMLARRSSQTKGRESPSG